MGQNVERKNPPVQNSILSESIFQQQRQGEDLGARKWKEYISSRLSLQGMLKEILQAEESDIR